MGNKKQKSINFAQSGVAARHACGAARLQPEKGRQFETILSINKTMEVEAYATCAKARRRTGWTDVTQRGGQTAGEVTLPWQSWKPIYESSHVGLLTLTTT